MPPIVASCIFAIAIASFFYLDRGHNTLTSKALWIPAAWLFLVSSRPVSMWLGMAPDNAGGDVYLEGSPIDRPVFAALELVGVAILAGRVQKMRPLLRKNIPIMLFFLFCAASILWSDFPIVAMKRYLKAIGDLVIVLIILTESDPLRAIKCMVTRLGFLLFPLSVLFVKYYPHLGRRFSGTWENTYTGITTQKNCLGLICMVWGVAFLWMFRAVYRDRLARGRRRQLLSYGAILGMIVWLLYMCDSKTSIMGLALAGGLTLLASSPMYVRKRALVHCLILAVVGLSVFALFFNAGGLLQSLGRDGTLSGRTGIWNLVLNVPNNSWVGSGFESFWLGSRLLTLRTGFSFPLNEAHNGFLEVYLNLGWTGVTLLAALLLNGYKRVAAQYRENPETGSLLIGFFLVAVFESLTEAGFRLMTPSWIFLLLAIVPPRKLFRLGRLRGQDVMVPALRGRSGLSAAGEAECSNNSGLHIPA